MSRKEKHLVMTQPELGKKIAELRKEKGLTQEELAKSSNVNIRTLQRIEGGEVVPRFYTLKTIFDALDYNVENFSSLTSDEKTNENIKQEEKEDNNSKGSKSRFSTREKIITGVSVLLVFAAVLLVWNYPRKTRPAELIGVWQRSSNNPKEITSFNKFEPERLSTFKIIDEYGNFTNMIANEINTCITVYGTYKISSKDTYIENIKKSYTNPKQNGLKNEINYEIINNQFLILTYNLNDKEINELWVKVGYGNPLSEKQVKETDK